MGPCSSKGFRNAADRRRSTLYGRRNTIIVRPHVDIVEGDCIDKSSWQGEKTKIFFIFGGPGTGKGRIIANLVQMYNVRFINVEDLLRDKLYETVVIPKIEEKLVQEGSEIPPETEEVDISKKMNENATKVITQHIITNPDEVSRSWLFQLIGDEMEKQPEGAIVLVDVVPNLKFLLRATAFVQRDTENIELEKFEKKYPIRFAINLQLEKQQLFDNIALTHACTKAPKVDTTESNKGTEENSDEIDMSRTERRFNMYSSSVEEFIDYFTNKGKLLSVDTSTGDIEAIWEGIRDYINEAGVASPLQGVEQVVLFQLSDGDFMDIDNNRYPMMSLSWHSLATSADPTPTELLTNLIFKMREHAVSTKAFLIDCQSSSLGNIHELQRSFGKKSALVFMEEDVGTLDFFLHGLRRKSQRKKSIARKAQQVYKVITTGDNEAFIFPISADAELCRLICNGYLQLRK